MKFILSETQALKRERDALKLRVQELEAENQRMREMHRLSWTKFNSSRSGSAGRTEEVDTSANAGSNTSKAYMLPTKASAHRASIPDPIVSKSENVSDSATNSGYADGKLVLKKDINQANFSFPTQSSSSKSRTFTRNRDWDEDPLPSTQQNLWDTEGSREVAEGVSELPTEGETRTCNKLEESNFDTSDTSLRKRCRLEDDHFVHTPASACFVPFKVQSRLEKRALCLAQETLWVALREHWPREQRWYYLEGPQQVTFCRSELIEPFGDEEHPSRHNQMCGQLPREVHDVILAMPDLRNTVCHADHCSTRKVDGLLKRAQVLAVVLQDENRAFKIRKLRDDLAAEATKWYEMIEANVGLFNLPYTKPWPVHLELLFSVVRLGPGPSWGCPTDKYPDVIERAAKEWQLMHVGPGELDPRYQSSLERARSFMIAADKVHLASVSFIAEKEDAKRRSSFPISPGKEVKPLRRRRSV